MFLLRCLFWLGLVFFQIAQREADTPSVLFNPTPNPSASLDQMAAKAAANQCRARPDDCVALAAAAAKLVKIDASAPSRDTLTRRDRKTAWKESD